MSELKRLLATMDGPMGDTEKTRGLGYGRFAGRYLQILGVVLLLWIPVNALLNDAFMLDLTGLILIWFGWGILQGRNGYRIAAVVACSLSIGLDGAPLLVALRSGASGMTATFLMWSKEGSIEFVALVALLRSSVCGIPLVALLHPNTRKAFGSTLRPRIELSISLVAMLVIAGGVATLPGCGDTEANARLVHGIEELDFVAGHQLDLKHLGGSASSGSAAEVAFFEGVYEVVSDGAERLPEGLITDIMAVIQEYLDQQGCSLIQDGGALRVDYGDDEDEPDLRTVDVWSRSRYFSLAGCRGRVVAVLIERDYMGAERIVGQLLITLSIDQ